MTYIYIYIYCPYIIPILRSPCFWVPETGQVARPLVSKDGMLKLPRLEVGITWRWPDDFLSLLVGHDGSEIGQRPTRPGENDGGFTIGKW